VDNRELHKLQLVGSISQLLENSTNIIFMLNDSSGTIECKQWIEKESAKYKKLTNIKEGSMIRVVGDLRENEGKTQLLVYDVFLVTDFNQLTHHILDVILTHCKHAIGPIPVCVLNIHINSIFISFPYFYQYYCTLCRALLLQQRCRLPLQLPLPPLLLLWDIPSLVLLLAFMVAWL
jgi:hypothetical protein